MIPCWLSAWCCVIVHTACLVGTSTFILPAAGEETSELRSMSIDILKSLLLSYCRAQICIVVNTKTHVQSKVFLNLNCVVDHRAVGIALLVVILAALLILGCWYFKKRSGYKLIRVRPSHFISDLCYSDLFQKENSVHPISECIMCSVCTHLFQACITMFLFCFITNPHTPFCNLQSPRSGSSGYTGSQYSEAGSPADNKMALTDFGSFRSVVRQLLQE